MNKQQDTKQAPTTARRNCFAFVMRPGNGWKHLAGAVYERHDGLRVHLHGICKLPNGEFVHNERALLQRLTRINGGNTKRGAMAWANTLEARAA